MATVDLTTFENEVLPEVHLAPYELFTQKLLETLHDFCHFTRAWQYEAPKLTVTLNQAEYTIAVPGSYAEPIAVEHLAVEDAPVKFREVAWLDQNIPDWRTRTVTDTSCFTQKRPATFFFPGLPTANGVANGIFYRVSLSPSLTADKIDSEFFDEWHIDVSSGVKAKLLLMDGKPWANVKLGTYYDGRYRAGRGAARIRVQTSYGPGARQIVRPVFKFAGR